MDERAESLRRRLYSPGATEEDRRRYAEVAPTVQDVRPVVVPTPRPRVPVLLVVVAAVLVAAGGAALTGRLAQADVTAAPRTVATSAPTRSPSLSTMERVSVSVDGVPTPGRRLHGQGQAVVPIDTASASFRGGSVVVVLSSSDRRPMGWEARRLVTRMDWSNYERVVATSAAAGRRGIPASESAPYTGDPPLWIAVEAPSGATWTLTVALTQGTGPTLH